MLQNTFGCPCGRLVHSLSHKRGVVTEYAQITTPIQATPASSFWFGAYIVQFTSTPYFCQLPKVKDKGVTRRLEELQLTRGLNEARQGKGNSTLVPVVVVVAATQPNS